MKFCKVLGIIGYVSAAVATTILTGGIAAPAWVVPVATGAATASGVISTHLGCQGQIKFPEIPSKKVKPDV